MNRKRHNPNGSYTHRLPHRHSSNATPNNDLRRHSTPMINSASQRSGRRRRRQMPHQPMNRIANRRSIIPRTTRSNLMILPIDTRSQAVQRHSHSSNRRHRRDAQGSSSIPTTARAGIPRHPSSATRIRNITISHPVYPARVTAPYASTK